MGKQYITVIIFLLISVNLTAQTETEKPFSIGKIVNIESKVLAEKRTLNIYLPPGYQKNDSTKFQVIYLLDGSADEDFLHITGLVQFLNMAYQMPATIVVGIANIDRRRDFTFPTKLKDLKRDYPTTGESEKFIAFLETELQPFIEKKYKTNAIKMLIGQSLGGLLATEILLKKPSMFTNYIIVSPSLWWDNESLLKQAVNLLANKEDIKLQVYISVGNEGRIMERDAKKIWDILNKSKWKNLKLTFLPLPKENHATILHKSVYEAFKILYPYKE